MPITTDIEIKAKWGTIEFWVLRVRSVGPRTRTFTNKGVFRDGGKPGSAGVNPREEILETKMDINAFKALDEKCKKGEVDMFTHPFWGGAFKALLSITDYDKGAIDNISVQIHMIESTDNKFAEEKPSAKAKEQESKNAYDDADEEIGDLREPE